MKKNFKRKNQAVLLLILLMSTIVGIFFSSLSKPQIMAKQASISPDLLLEQLLSCPPGESKTSYACTVPYVVSYLRNNNIEPFFQLLEQKLKTDPKINGYCHPIGHSIGRALVQKYGYIDALNKRNPFCADGTIMGIMEEFLLKNFESHPSTSVIVQKAGNACKEFAKGDPVKSAACIHGTGHGLMPLVDYDTQKGLDLCSQIKSKDVGSCYDAVFMEKFMPSNPARKVAKTEDLYQYCSNYNSVQEQKLRCFGYLPYAWKEWGKKPEEILKLCSAPQVDVTGCGRALSRLYLPGFRNKSDLTFFEIYHSASIRLQEPMAKFGGIGIVEYLPSKGREYCKLLKKPEEACINQLKDTGRSMDIDVP